MLGIECIAVGVVRHAGPVDAAHIFAPAQDLADEALHAGQGRACVVQGVLGCGNHLAWIEQLEVQCDRQVRVI